MLHVMMQSLYCNISFHKILDNQWKGGMKHQPYVFLVRFNTIIQSYRIGVEDAKEIGKKLCILNCRKKNRLSQKLLSKVDLIVLFDGFLLFKYLLYPVA